MSSKNSALASLTATYTDSENESDDDSTKTDGSTESQVIIPQPSPMKLSSENSSTPPQPNSNPPSQSYTNKALRLVSYNDDNDNVISDEENDSMQQPGSDNTNMDVSEDNTGEATNDTIDKSVQYGFQLPPEPKGKCSQELQDKIANLFERMTNTNMDMNKIIQERKEFRNPSIYEKLIQYCDINELGTNYPPEIYDPLQWGKESYYEELALAQKVEMDKMEKARKTSTKSEIIVAAKKAEEDAKKRKSKWDQPGPAQGASSLKPATLIQPSLTTNITGTKSTVISAFGSLPKKPKG